MAVGCIDGAARIARSTRHFSLLCRSGHLRRTHQSTELPRVRIRTHVSNWANFETAQGRYKVRQTNNQKENFTLTLTDSMKQSPIEQLTVDQLAKKFPAFYRPPAPPRLIIVFTEARHCTTHWDTELKSALRYNMPLRYVLVLHFFLGPSLQWYIFPQGIFLQNAVWHNFPHPCQMFCKPYPSSFSENYKLQSFFIMQLYPFMCYCHR